VGPEEHGAAKKILFDATGLSREQVGNQWSRHELGK
jgi:hypothetical protein